MGTGRLEAFSDGVLAIVITITVLEIKVPQGEGLEALYPLLHVFLAYVLSFAYLGIYWNNHHHLMHASNKVSGAILWANLHLLFWLSLIPVTTGWMGETEFAPWPVALYGTVLLMAGFAYYLLARALIVRHGAESILARSLGADWKTLVSMAVYLCAIPLAFVLPLIACACYAGIAILWLVPDRRIERALEN